MATERSVLDEGKEPRLYLKAQSPCLAYIKGSIDQPGTTCMSTAVVERRTYLYNISWWRWELGSVYACLDCGATRKNQREDFQLELDGSPFVLDCRSPECNPHSPVEARAYGRFCALCGRKFALPSNAVSSIEESCRDRILWLTENRVEPRSLSEIDDGAPASELVKDCIRKVRAATDSAWFSVVDAKLLRGHLYFASCHLAVLARLSIERVERVKALHPNVILIDQQELVTRASELYASCIDAAELILNSSEPNTWTEATARIAFMVAGVAEEDLDEMAGPTQSVKDFLINYKRPSPFDGI